MEETLLGQARDAPVFNVGFGIEERRIPKGNPNGLVVGDHVTLDQNGDVFVFRNIPNSKAMTIGTVIMVNSVMGTVQIRKHNENNQ